MLYPNLLPPSNRFRGTETRRRPARPHAGAGPNRCHSPDFSTDLQERRRREPAQSKTRGASAMQRMKPRMFLSGDSSAGCAPGSLRPMHPVGTLWEPASSNPAHEISRHAAIKTDNAAIHERSPGKSLGNKPGTLRFHVPDENGLASLDAHAAPPP